MALLAEALVHHHRLLVLAFDVFQAFLYYSNSRISALQKLLLVLGEALVGFAHGPVVLVRHNLHVLLVGHQLLVALDRGDR